MSSSLPVIDLSLASGGGEARARVARQLDAACSEFGFFYLIGHAVPAQLTDGLLAQAREFFARDQAEKMRIHMSRGGRAWRGYFPVGGELTSGQPDLKEGLYFGNELDDQHPLVRAGTPMHGRNLFPDDVQFRASVLAYMSALEIAGQQVLSLMAEGLSLPGDYFLRRFTAEPTCCSGSSAIRPMKLRARGGGSAHTRTMDCSRCCSRTPSGVCRF